MSIEIAILIIIGAFACEFIDASMGMLYGTILSPVLIILGFDPLLVVPSILLSQAAGGFTASIIHHRLKNADFTFKIKNPQSITQKLSALGHIGNLKKRTTRDFKIAVCITLLGISAAIFSVFIAVNIPKNILTTYIGVLVIVMGAILLTKTTFKFSWGKIIAVGMLSSFNKGISGGGFGPVVTSGQVIAGRNGKNSIGVTTLAEAPICITGFLTYFFTKGISDWRFIILLTIGAVIGGFIGPYFTATFKSEKKLKFILGLLTLGLGVWTLFKTWF